MSDFRAVATAAAIAAAERGDVLAVLLGGSVARGDAVATSDVDLIIVATPSSELVGVRRVFMEDVLVETVAHSVAGWRERFGRPSPRWLYAFLEAEVLHDSGIAQELIAAAREALTRYRTPQSVLEELAVEFWHGQAKVDRALASADPAVRGYQASLAVDWIIDSLFAVHNAPVPAASRRLDYLAGVDLEPDIERLWIALLTGNADARLDAAAKLVCWLRSRLPEPNLTAT